MLLLVLLFVQQIVGVAAPTSGPFPSPLRITEIDHGGVKYKVGDVIPNEDWLLKSKFTVFNDSPYTITYMTLSLQLPGSKGLGGILPIHQWLDEPIPPQSSRVIESKAAMVALRGLRRFIPELGSGVLIRWVDIRTENGSVWFQGNWSYNLDVIRKR